MIDNNDRIGNYFVFVVAKKYVVACFQCPTIDDAAREAYQIKQRRYLQGLTTSRYYYRILLSKGKDGFHFSKRFPMFDLKGIK